MALSRRELLGTSFGTAVSGCTVFSGGAYAQQSSPLRLPIEVFVQDPARVASLKRAVRVMKARRPSVPTSWFFQAAIQGPIRNAHTQIDKR